MATLPIFRVMSWNIQGGNKTGAYAFANRASGVNAVLQNIKPDIAGFQEVVEDNFPILQESFPTAPILLAKVLDGDRIKPERLPVAWSERFVLHELGTQWHSPTPDIQSIGWDAKYARGFSWYLLFDLATPGVFLMINTHFDHLGQEARFHSAENILHFIESCRSDLPIIITGDFNCGPYRHPKQEDTDPRPYAMLLGAGFHDAYRSVDPSWPPPFTFHRYQGTGAARNPDPYAWMIDFIFVRNIRVMHAGIHRFNDDEIYPSDHYPVFADLQFLS